MRLIIHMLGIVICSFSSSLMAQEENIDDENNGGMNKVVIEQVGQERIILDTPEDVPVTVRHTREGEAEESLFIQQEGAGNEIESWQDIHKQKLTVSQKGSGNRIVVKQRN